jgi:hypothetical protein
VWEAGEQVIDPTGRAKHARAARARGLTRGAK